MDHLICPSSTDGGIRQLKCFGSRSHSSPVRLGAALPSLDTAHHPAHQRYLVLQKPYLPEHARVIPIDPLAADFVTTKLHDHDDIHDNRLVRRRNVRQEPVHRLAVRKRCVQLVYELPISPTTRFTGVICKSSGQAGMKSSR